MQSAARPIPVRSPAPNAGWRGYALATAAVAAVAAASAPLLGHLDLANIAMLFPLAVLFAAIRLGRGPAVLAAFLSVALFDFYFVPPHFTLVVSDLQYLLTFTVLLAVALITAELAGRLRLQRDAAEHREQRTRALYGTARELSAALTTEQIGEIADRYIRENFHARARLLLPDERPAGSGVEESAAQLPDDARTGPTDGTLHLPLRAPMRVRGVLSVEPYEGALAPDADQRRLLDAFAALIAISLERVHYISIAREAEVETASERLRNSLLGALSHDLRTPLTAMVGLADALSLADPPLAPEQAELAHAIRDEALRTSALVNNLLDMARLQSGPVRLRREWQPLEDVVGAALQARARQLAGHRLQLDLPLDLPLVDVDAVLMERALCNLLENAAKYTPAGSTIEIVARPLGDRIEIVVADDGPGLPPGREHELFAKFTRGRRESTIPGVGLGLAIVQAIVEAHGGRVRAENRDGGGSRLVLDLPRGEPPELPDRDA